MNSIGERLREERLRRGFTIEQIAESTKINPSLLEAIEANDLERLPGTFFTRSFVRQYAGALGMDAAELEPELDRVAGAEPAPPREAEREAISVPPVDSTGLGPYRPPRSLGALITFVLILAACSGLYILWQRSRQPRPPAPVQTAPAAAPSPAVHPVPVSTPPAAAQPAPPQPEPAAPPEQPAQAAEPTPAQPIETLSTLAPGQAAAVTVQIRATAASWIRVVADGKYLYSGTMQPNETRTVQAGKWIQLRTGNAGGIELQWNGKPVASIGAAGDVRTLEFSPEGFRVPTPPAPKPAQPGAGF